MKLLSTLRSLVPPSSRSFHQLFREFAEARDDFSGKLNWLTEQVDAIREEQVRQGVEQQRRIKAIDAHLKLFSWQLYREEQESYDDTRKRFFRALPKADGELRMQQLACTCLLRDFDALCRAEGLNYWMISGTLLGAVRHGGFIPWDDDADLGMMRDDLDKLIALTAQHDRFQTTEVLDGYVNCRQIRFRYRDEKIPCFIDIFFFDASSEDKKASFAAMQENRKKLVEEIWADDAISDWVKGAPLVEPWTPLGSKVSKHFDAAITRSYSQNGYLTREVDSARSIVWGVDNLDSLSGRPVIFEYDDVYPLSTLSFEDIELLAPRNPAAVLSAIFGDYLDLPNDLGSQSTHISGEPLQDEESLSAIKALIQNSCDNA